MNVDGVELYHQWFLSWPTCVTPLTSRLCVGCKANNGGGNYEEISAGPGSRNTRKNTGATLEGIARKNRRGSLVDCRPQPFQRFSEVWGSFKVK